MKYSVSAIVLGFFAVLNAAAPTPDDKPDPGQVALKGVSYAGTGCPAGTASGFYSQDLQTFTISLDKSSQPTIGPDTKISDQTKNCNLNFQVQYPPGYQYTLYKYEYTGYVLLEPGVTLKQKSDYWFAGFASNKATFQFTLNGPYDGDYTFTDTLQSTAWAWSPCGTSASLNINTQATLTGNNPKPPGPITPRIKGYRHVYGVNWRRCS